MKSNIQNLDGILDQSLNIAARVIAGTQLQTTGLALLVIAYVLIATRKYISLENISEFMMIHAIGWAIFAIGGLYLTFSSGDPIGNNPFFYQALIFLVISAGFYAKRN